MPTPPGRTRPVTRPAAAIALAALGLAACGGSGASGEEAAIRRVINVGEESANPSKCNNLATQRFLEQTTLEKGKQALKDCREGLARDAQSKSVDIHAITVHGATA